MDIQLSSLSLQRKTQETVSLVLLNQISSPSLKKTLQEKIKSFISKRTTFYAFAFAFFLLISPNETAFANENETKTFIATAYYSPLPNQQKYYRGSYEADKKLNGEGITASDGTPVFVGMIAAPKNYAFGTKIALDGLGIVSVHDRGGAISAKDGYDRIDIWMGYGDEGLERTLAWGRREIIGKIVDKNTPVSFSLENLLDNAPKPLEIALKKLKAIGYDTENLSVTEVITRFQLDYGVIINKNDDGAGIYGPKTTAKLAQIFKEKQQNFTIATPEIQPLENLATFTPSNTGLDENSARELSQNMQTTSIGETAESVKNLQNFLKKMNYYTGETHGTMTLETLKSLRKYQYDNDLIQTGRTDIRTQQIIRQDLMK